MTISNASLLTGPDEVVRGRMEAEPVESGKLVAIRQSGDRPGPPLASWVIGRDETDPGYTVLYTDERGVSRVYQMTLIDRRWTIWRDNADFSQRFEASVSDDERLLEGSWQKRHANGPWEHDFDVTYSRR